MSLENLGSVSLAREPAYLFGGLTCIARSAIVKSGEIHWKQYKPKCGTMDFPDGENEYWWLPDRCKPNKRRRLLLKAQRISQNAQK
jgi:hypothetical protein